MRTDRDRVDWSTWLQQRFGEMGQASPDLFDFLHFLSPDWSPGSLQMRWDCRDIAGLLLKVQRERVFVETLPFRPNCVSERYLSFFGPSLHAYQFLSTSTRFGVCFSFDARSLNLISVFQIIKTQKTGKCKLKTHGSANESTV